MTIAEILKAMRNELSISQEMLARDLTVSFATLNRWENRRANPSRLAMSKLKEYAAKSGVSDTIVAELNRIRT
ncbi:MAG: helix-turn-helix domain-containing protein [Acidaminococcales bacterium]|jgi:DNA-binding transcriptional regulator YiaG|nr:helix-turn-helix domain-containing protein [Acidaminococcales bacterium]